MARPDPAPRTAGAALGPGAEQPADTHRRPGGHAARRLHHPRSVAVIAAVVGAFATAVGAGLGVRHLVEAGVTGTSVLGLAVLLVGLVLVVYAWRVAWRRLRRWRRLWLVPITVVALAGMWSVAVGTSLAVAPRNDLGSSTPADQGLTYTDVTLRTSDGVRLSAWYVPSANSAAVVTLPGSGSTRTGTLAQSAVLARHGFGVLLVDPRGQGRSGGQAMDAGWYGDRDVAAAVAFLRHRPGIDADRIGVLGLSMGGEEAIGAAASNPGIRAVVAEGATHRTAADKAGFLPGGVNGALQRGLDRVTYGVAALFSPAPTPPPLHTAVARATATPFLLIAGGDAVDEAEAAGYLRTAAPDRVQVWTVPRAAHTQGLATAPEEWTARVTEFFDRALGTTAQR
jgi:pimeloyl-ACP methyl ester carboxylesterase